MKNVGGAEARVPEDEAIQGRAAGHQVPPLYRLQISRLGGHFQFGPLSRGQYVTCAYQDPGRTLDKFLTKTVSNRNEIEVSRT